MEISQKINLKESVKGCEALDNDQLRKNNYQNLQKEKEIGCQQIINLITIKDSKDKLQGILDKNTQQNYYINQQIEIKEASTESEEESQSETFQSRSNKIQREQEAENSENANLDIETVFLKGLSLQQQYQVHEGTQKGTWTEEEDIQLQKLVEDHGAKGWNYIASMLPGRLGKQCRERWHNHLDPNILKNKWTLEEDKNLMNLYKQYGKKWSLIAKYMPGRTDNTIKNRFNSALKMHKTFQEYIDYKQKKYEKSLSRKSKGIYRKKNEDEIAAYNKKQNIYRQNIKLQVMKNLVNMEKAKCENTSESPGRVYQISNLNTSPSTIQAHKIINKRQSKQQCKQFQTINKIDSQIIVDLSKEKVFDDSLQTETVTSSFNQVKSLDQKSQSLIITPDNQSKDQKQMHLSCLQQNSKTQELLKGITQKSTENAVQLLKKRSMPSIFQKCNNIIRNNSQIEVSQKKQDFENIEMKNPAVINYQNRIKSVQIPSNIYQNQVDFSAQSNENVDQQQNNMQILLKKQLQNKQKILNKQNLGNNQKFMNAVNQIQLKIKDQKYIQSLRPTYCVPYLLQTKIIKKTSVDQVLNTLLCFQSL